MTAVDRITYQQTFPTGAYANIKLGIEMMLVPGVDDVQEAFQQAKQIVNDAFKSMNPESLPTQTDYNTRQPREIQVEKIEIGNIPSEIQTCKDKKTLESYKHIVRGKPELEKLYFDKLDELS